MQLIENFKTTPYAHQRAALEKGCFMESFAYLMEMGTGKSKVTIDNAYQLFKKGLIDSVFVLAPKGVFMKWLKQEFPKHLPHDVATNTYLWSSSSTKKNQYAQQSIITSKHCDDTIKVVSMNIEAFSGKRNTRAMDFSAKFLRANKTLLVLDESTVIKHHKAERTKQVTDISSYAKYRRILTGSPVTDSPMDLYAQFNFLDWRILNQTSFYAFRSRYAVIEKINLRPITDPRTGKILKQPSYPKVVAYRRTEELAQKIAPWSYRVTKEDCLDLPPKVYETVEVELTPQQKKMYAEMKELAVIEIAEKGLSSAMIAITQMLRLHQIVCGHVKMDTGELVDIPCNRLSALMGVLEEAQGKVVIWANYIEDIQAIAREIASVYGQESLALYYGAVSKEQRQRGNDLFQDPKSKVRFFVGNTQTGGMGIDLFASHTVVYYSNNFKLEDRLQSEDRCHRIGQTNKVTYIDLVAPGTVDEKILKALRDKMDIAQQITGDNYREWVV